MRRISAFVAIALFACTLPAEAAETVRDDIRGKLRQAASSGEKVIIRGLNLGGDTPADVEVQRFKVWADDGVRAVHKADGSVERLGPPDIQSFKGRVLGAADESAVYLSIQPNGKVEGLALVGHRRFSIGTAVPIMRGRNRSIDNSDLTGAIAISEEDLIDDLKNGEEKPWTCELDNMTYGGDISLAISEERKGALRKETNGGNVAGATYSLRLTIETDNELRAGFASLAALDAYITALIGKVSVIYQRDLDTTVTIGHVNLYDTGSSDPWLAGVSASAGLAELGKFYGTSPGLANPNYGGTQRSSVVWISGRATSGGVAWLNMLCQPNFACGPTGGSCGGAAYADSFAGGYAFCGTSGAAQTVVPDPNLTVNGVQYGLPTSNSWMLTQVAHELGHNVGSSHTHCIPLTAGEKATAGVTRNFVDECYGTEGGCFSGTNTAPAELGTIMSYCHNIIYGGSFRASRFTFHKAGEASAKMRSVLIGQADNPATPGTNERSGIEGATANPTMTTEATPLPCSAGRTASVASCSGCTYSWNIISGGVVTAGATSATVTFTPSAANVLLQVTVTKNGACAINLVRSISASCATNAPPTNIIAAATGATSVSVNWTAAMGAVSYQVFRSAGAGYSQIGTSATTSYNDLDATANTAYLYRVRAVDGSAAVSADSSADYATAVAYTDATLTQNTTVVKAAHFNEMRTAINALRVLAGLGTTTFTDPVLNNSVTVKAAHINELRTNLQTVRATLGFNPINFTDPTLTGGSSLISSHVAEIRLVAE